MPQGHVIDIMTYSSYSLQYYSFRKTKALVSLTSPCGIRAMSSITVRFITQNNRDIQAYWLK